MEDTRREASKKPLIVQIQKVQQLREQLAQAVQQQQQIEAAQQEIEVARASAEAQQLEGAQQQQRRAQPQLETSTNSDQLDHTRYKRINCWGSATGNEWRNSAVSDPDPNRPNVDPDVRRVWSSA